jgi:hypothetical protein
MAQTSLDTLGPVDYVVVEFPVGQSNFTGEMADELVAPTAAGTIRVIDILGPSPVAKTAVVAAAVTPGRRRRRI